MPQFGFYMAGTGIVGLGRAGLLLAWDPHDRGPSAADDINISDIGLYSWIAPLQVISGALFKMRSKSPIAIPAEGCPIALDGGADHDFFVRFGVKPGGTISSLLADAWLEVFDNNSRVYGINAPGATVKIELGEGSVAIGLAEYSMQDRVVYDAWEDPLEGWAAMIGGFAPARELWRDLMTPDMPLNWSPIG